LHSKLLAGTSLIVTDQIAEIFLPVVRKSLMREFFNVSDTQLVDSAVEDALIGYVRNPGKFDPCRSGLFTYLRLRARSVLLNLIAKHKPSMSVEVEAADEVNNMESEGAADPESELIRQEADERVMADIRAIFSNPDDVEMVKLMMLGVRETGQF